MTNEEAINSLRKLKSFHNGSYGESISLAIEALEKQTPKRPHRNYRNFGGRWCDCGGYVQTKNDGFKFCPMCGQAIDWSEEND